jgi:hypothetical protein
MTDVEYLGQLSGPNFDDRAKLYQRIDFIDFFVCYGDASIGPIFQPMLAADPSPLRTQAMNFHVASGRNVKFSGLFAVRRTGVGNVERLVELAGRVFPIDGVNALRSFVIALPILCADRLGTKRNFVGFYDLRTARQREGSLALLDQNSIHGFVSFGGEDAWVKRRKSEENQKRQDARLKGSKHRGSYELPMSQPVRKTSTPPTIT